MCNVMTRVVNVATLDVDIVILHFDVVTLTVDVATLNFSLLNPSIDVVTFFFFAVTHFSRCRDLPLMS